MNTKNTYGLKLLIALLILINLTSVNHEKSRVTKISLQSRTISISDFRPPRTNKPKRSSGAGSRARI
jgi:hypothetical protein